MKNKIIFFLILNLFITNIFAQLEFDYANPQEYEIGDISISGIKFLNANTLRQISGLTVGEKIYIPGDEIRGVIQKFWKQGLFSDVQVFADSIVDGKVYLNIYLLERPRLSRYEFVGVKSMESKDLDDKVNLVRGNQITDNIINNAKIVVKNYYIDKGFYKSKVNVSQKEDTSLLNTVILIFDIEKGEKIKINDITVEGNSIFPDKKVHRLLKETKKKRWYGFLKPSKYIPVNYTDDLKALVAKYNKEGYRDAEIVSDTIYDFDENTLNIHLAIKEGNQYYFRNIIWVGNTKYQSDALSQILGIKSGDVFNQELLDMRLTYDEDAVGNIYMNDGYLFYHSIPTEVLIVNDSIDLEIRIFEGKQATINKVTVTGNTKTNDQVIYREIRSMPGMLFSKSDITRTIRELAQLGHFDPEKLNINPIPNQATGTVDLEYTVEEKPNDQVELSGGFGANMIVGRLGLSFNNFSLQNAFNKSGWDPLPTGDGQRLSISAQSNGQYYQTYSISFTEPYLGGKKPNSLTSSIYYSRYTNYDSPSYDYYGSYDYTNVEITGKMDVIGASVGLGRRLKVPDDYFTMYNEISYQHYLLDNYTYFLIQNGDLHNLSFTNVFGRNSVDNPIYARSGGNISLSLQLTPPYSMFYKNTETMEDEEKYNWIEYHKWKFNAEWYARIVENFVMHFRAQFGFLGYYDKDFRSPIQRFSLGGDGFSGFSFYGKENIALKGYSNDILSPTEGSNIYQRMTFDLRYPISLNPQATVYAKAFFEA
ncbi:MAG: outer membrane protein assembly factor BamA, partial [Bacteroidales bacterium]|nr:outer membrane protein assembly factor BamA [Bacteroidales bacterium]